MDWSFLAIWIGLPCLAGYVAHKKRRSWFKAAFLTMLVPPLGIIAAFLENPHPSTGQPSYRKEKILFGLLPMWVSIVPLIVGGLISKSAEYWSVAPWIVVGAIPASAVALALVEVVLRVRSSGKT